MYKYILFFFNFTCKNYKINNIKVHQYIKIAQNVFIILHYHFAHNVTAQV